MDIQPRAEALREAEFERVGRRDAGFDGLRGIAVLLVVLTHAQSTPGFPSPHWLSRLDLGALGVRMFFVLSGYLITGILLRDLERWGRVDLLRFFVRRTLRLWPAFGVLLIAVTLARYAGLIELSDGDLLHAGTYTMNFFDVPPPAPELRHTWTLAVEEQFYLVWPLLFVALGPRRASACFAALLLLLPCLRALALPHRLAPALAALLRQSGYDSLAVGCVLARLEPRLRPVPRALAILAVLGMVSSCWRRLHTPYLEALVVFPALNACIAVVLLAVRRGGSLEGIVGISPLAGLGLVSYSLYLWQQPFFRRGAAAWPYRFPFNFVCIAALTLASFVLVERPTRDLRERAWQWLNERWSPAQRSARSRS